VLQASVALLSAEYDEFIGVDPDTGDPVDLSGNSLRSAPDLSYNLSASYEIGLSQGSSITLMGNVSWQDDVYYSQFNKPSIGQEAYALANARVAWISATGRTEVAAFARNLLDEEYYDSAIEFGFGPLMHVAPPRMYGLEIRVSY
jgi:iron complex outermembrane receptor protein